LRFVDVLINGSSSSSSSSSSRHGQDN